MSCSSNSQSPAWAPPVARPRRRLSGLAGQLLLAPRSCATSQLRIDPIPGCTFGAVVTGVSLATDDLDDPNTWAKVKQAILDHVLLVFPGQENLTKQMRQAFATRFGELASDQRNIPFTNVQKDGSLAGLGEGDYDPSTLKGADKNRTTEAWHTDITFTPLAVKYGFLYAELVPREGGETEYADIRAGYDVQTDATKAKIADLAAWHAISYSSARRTGLFFKRGDAARLGAVYMEGAFLRPLVKVHPETGRRCLHGATSHAFAVEGLSREESTALLDDLIDTACQPPRTYKHSWKPGDLVVWDERACLHRARPYDPREARRLWGMRVKGDVPNESALPESIKDPSLGVKKLEEEVAFLQATRPWEKPRPPSQRGGW